jgi:phosphoribosylformylglycinamidine cyclo-ligase
MTEGGASYAAAGVDVEAGERAVALMRASIAAAQRPEVVGDFGGFAGLFDISNAKGMTRPILATSTDGVGTKIAVARAMDVHHTVGLDLVAMVIDDLVVCGAEPLYMTDYIAVGAVVPERVADIVTGIVDGARLLGPERVRAGDAVVAMASSGLHSNGYSLARLVLLGDDGPGLDAHIDDLGRSVGEELLEPTRIYAQDCLALSAATDVHAFSHVTGGGLAANLARVLPEHLAADLDRATWRPQPIYDLIGSVGRVSADDMERTFNMGIGMIAVMPADATDYAVELLADRGLTAWVCGSVRDRVAGERGDADAKGGAGGAVRLRGDYARR